MHRFPALFKHIKGNRRILSARLRAAQSPAAQKSVLYSSLSSGALFTETGETKRREKYFISSRDGRLQRLGRIRLSGDQYRALPLSLAAKTSSGNFLQLQPGLITRPAAILLRDFGCATPASRRLQVRARLPHAEGQSSASRQAPARLQCPAKPAAGWRPPACPWDCILLCPHWQPKMPVEPSTALLEVPTPNDPPPLAKINRSVAPPARGGWLVSTPLRALWLRGEGFPQPLALCVHPWSL